MPQVTKKVASPLPTTDNIFYAGTGMLLCRSEEKVGQGCRVCSWQWCSEDGSGVRRRGILRCDELHPLWGHSRHVLSLFLPRAAPCSDFSSSPPPVRPSCPHRSRCLTCSSAPRWRSCPPLPSSMRCGAGT